MNGAGLHEFLMEPSESLLFGPPKSFSAGEAHRIRSEFPPSPMAFQGAIRTQLLFGAEPPLDFAAPDINDTIRTLVGPSHGLPSGWQIVGPFPAGRRVLDATEDRNFEALEAAGTGFALDRPVVEPWVPTPRFLLNQGSADLPPVPARPVQSHHPALSDLDDDRLLYLGRPDVGAVAPLGGWIDPHNLYRALTGEPNRLRWNRQGWAAQKPPFVREEVQPGLAVEQGTAKHGLLYFAAALRFQPGCGFYGALRAPLRPPLRESALTAGAGQAGRKRRLVRFAPVEQLHPLWTALVDGAHLPAEPDTDERFWLIALTPLRIAPDEHGRETPRPGTESGLPLPEEAPPGVRMDVQAALTGPLVTIGGFDMAGRRPRPNRSYLPAGSCWLFRLTGSSPADRGRALRSLHDRHCLGTAQETALGFGHTMVGLAPRQTESG